MSLSETTIPLPRLTLLIFARGLPCIRPAPQCLYQAEAADQAVQLALFWSTTSAIVSATPPSSIKSVRASDNEGQRHAVAEPMNTEAFRAR